MLDYITYTWVKDDEVAFNEEVIQVTSEVNKEFEILKDARIMINGSSFVKIDIYRQRGNPCARRRVSVMLLQQLFELHHWNERTIQGGVYMSVLYKTERSSSVTRSSLSFRSTSPR